MKMIVETNKIICTSFLLFSILGHAETYFSDYHNEKNEYTHNYVTILDNSSDNLRSVLETSHQFTNTHKKYDLNNSNDGINCVKFINKIFSDNNLAFKYDLSTYSSHSQSPYVRAESNLKEEWSVRAYGSLTKDFEVYEKDILLDEKGKVIRVENPGFKPQAGDILIFPPRHFRKDDKFISTGHVVIVVDPNNCIAANSTPWTLDPKTLKRDLTKRGVMFHSINSELRCKNGVWYAWDASGTNQFWTLLRPRNFIGQKKKNHNLEINKTNIVADKNASIKVALNEESQHKLVYPLAIAKSDSVFAANKKDLMNFECGVIGRKSIIQIIEQDKNWIKGRLAYAREGQELECDTFYAPTKQFNLINYKSDIAELSFNNITITEKITLHKSDSADAPVVGFLNPGDKVIGLAQVKKNGQTWIQTNHDLFWIKITE